MLWRIGREAAGGDGSQRVADRVEDRHSDRDQGDYLNDGQADVERPQSDRRMADARCQPVLLRARRLRKEHLPSGDRQSREHSDEQRDDAIPPNHWVMLRHKYRPSP